MYFTLSKMSTSSLNAAWGGFTDFDTGIASYRVSIGKCPGCTDVLSEVDLGLITGTIET